MRGLQAVTVFKVTGETNTNDLSPAQDAWSRPDIPLHAVAMLKNSREGLKLLMVLLMILEQASMAPEPA